MAYTLTNIINQVSTALHDTGTAVWGTAEIGGAVAAGLVELATYKPRITLATVTPSAGTPDLDISGTAFAKLLYGPTEESFESVEFKVDKEPKRFRNFKVHQDTLTMDITFEPDGTDAARLYLREPHILSGAGTTSLSPEMERIIVDLVASRLAVGIAIKYVNKIPIGGAQTVGHFITWGEHKLGMVIGEMKALVRPSITRRWPTVE